jgi:hypothetical protein
MKKKAAGVTVVEMKKIGVKHGHGNVTLKKGEGLGGKSTSLNKPVDKP